MSAAMPADAETVLGRHQCVGTTFYPRRGCPRRPRALGSLLVALCLVVAAATLAGCGLGGGGGDRSAKTFCSELTDGNDKMRAQYEAADPNDETGLSQLAVGLLNLGEYTTMVHHLDDAAPDAISTEMHDSRQAWDKQADNVPGGLTADDIAGSIMKTLMVAIMANGSMRTVDQYALDHCDLQVFGTVVDTAALQASASVAATTWACEDAGLVGGTDLTAPDTTFVTLTELLDQMSAATDYPELAAAATALLAKVRMLSAPATSLEALGQVQAAGGPEVADLYDALAAACPDQASVIRGQAQAAAGVGSVMDGDTLHNAAELNGSCDNETGAEILGFPTATTMLAYCAGDRAHIGYALMDLTTGDITWFTDDAADGGLVGPYFNDSVAAASGTAVAWTTVEHIKASGLNPRTWSATLHIHDLATDLPLETVDVPLVQGGRGASPGSDFGVGADRLGFYVQIPHSALPEGSHANGVIRHYDTAGNLMWVRPNHDTGVGYALTPISTSMATWGIGGGEIIDLYTGQPVWSPARHGDSFESGVDACGLYASSVGFVGSNAWVQDTAAGPKVTALSDDFPADDDSYMLTPAGELQTSPGAWMVGLDGKTTWKLSAKIVANAWAFGNWVVVVNTSHEKVLVDPATGTEVTDVDTSLRDTILRTFPGAQAFVTEDGQTAWVENGEAADDWTRLPAADVCGAAAPDLTQ